MLYKHDRIFVFGKPSRLHRAIKSLQSILNNKAKNTFSPPSLSSSLPQMGGAGTGTGTAVNNIPPP